MARIVLVTDLSKERLSPLDILLNSSSDLTNIKPAEPEKVYSKGDKIYFVIDGNIVIKEVVQDNVTIEDIDDPSKWQDSTPSILGETVSSTQDPNKPQNVTPLQIKITNDLSKIILALSPIADLEGAGLESITKIDLCDPDSVEVEGAISDFGRIVF